MAAASREGIGSGMGQQDARLRIDAMACPQCSGPLEPGEERCPWCASAVVLDSRAAALDMDAIRREYAHLNLEELRARANKRPINPGARYALGMAYLELGLLDEAADALRSAADRMPEHAPFQAALARVYDRQEQAGMSRRGAMADDRIERALARDPENLDALLLASERAARKGEPPQAFAYLRRAAEVDPDASRPLALAYINGNREKIIASWAYAPHRAETTIAGEMSGTSAASTGCLFMILFGIIIVVVGLISGTPLDGLWWIIALVAAVAMALIIWLGARMSRGKAREMLAVRTPEERAIEDGTATTFEMVDALDRWSVTEIETLRRAAETAKSDRAPLEMVIAAGELAEALDNIANPPRRRRRKSPW
jgi:tetratricopeptide (TPR) repeat protein